MSKREITYTVAVLLITILILSVSLTEDPPTLIQLREGSGLKEDYGHHIREAKRDLRCSSLTFREDSDFFLEQAKLDVSMAVLILKKLSNRDISEEEKLRTEGLILSELKITEKRTIDLGGLAVHTKIRIQRNCMRWLDD